MNEISKRVEPVAPAVVITGATQGARQGAGRGVRPRGPHPSSCCARRDGARHGREGALKRAQCRGEVRRGRSLHGRGLRCGREGARAERALRRHSRQQRRDHVGRLLPGPGPGDAAADRRSRCARGGRSRAPLSPRHDRKALRRDSQRRLGRRLHAGALPGDLCRDQSLRALAHPRARLRDDGDGRARRLACPGRGRDRRCTPRRAPSIRATCSSFR